MSNTITPEEYRRMIGKKATPSPKDTAALVRQDVKEIFERNEKKEPSGKSGKLDTVAAIKAFANYFELDPKSTNFWITQMRNSGKI